MELREVVAERTVGQDWLVSRGLLPGDKLIIEGVARVKPGQSVTPVPIKPAAANDAGSAAPPTSSPG